MRFVPVNWLLNADTNHFTWFKFFFRLKLTFSVIHTYKFFFFLFFKNFVQRIILLIKLCNFCASQKNNWFFLFPRMKEQYGLFCKPYCEFAVQRILQRLISHAHNTKSDAQSIRFYNRTALWTVFIYRYYRIVHRRCCSFIVLYFIMSAPFCSVAEICIAALYCK